MSGSRSLMGKIDDEISYRAQIIKRWKRLLALRLSYRAYVSEHDAQAPG
jgi:hypothetical protein